MRKLAHSLMCFSFHHISSQVPAVMVKQEALAVISRLKNEAKRTWVRQEQRQPKINVPLPEARWKIHLISLMPEETRGEKLE